MSGFGDKSFGERLSSAAAARNAALERFRSRPPADDPAVAERRAAQQALSEARAARTAAREAARRTLDAEEAASAAADRDRLAAEAALEAAARGARRHQRGRAQGGAGRALRGPQDAQVAEPAVPAAVLHGSGERAH